MIKLVLLFFFIIILIGAAFFILKPKTSSQQNITNRAEEQEPSFQETSSQKSMTTPIAGGLKEYTNLTNGYSATIPAIWTIQEDSLNSAKVKFFMPLCTAPSQPDCSNEYEETTELEIRDNPQNLELKEFALEIIKDEGKEYMPLFIGHIKALFVDADPDRNISYVFMEKGQQVYILKHYSSDPLKGYFSEFYGTFKFIDN